MLDGAEDPERMLDQLVRDFTNNIAEAEEAVAPASSLEEEFASLEDSDTEAEVESRLSQLRSGAAAGAGSGA